MHLLAISLRTCGEGAHPDRRDSIARDWWPFLRKALPDVAPLLLPNDSVLAARLMRLPGIVGLLLTGGDDIGSAPERDEAERAALREAAERSLPVLGICRGLQFLAHEAGWRIAPCDPALHRVRRHRIRTDLAGEQTEREVNSYHGYCVVDPGEGFLRPAGWSEDGVVEAVAHREKPIRGIMWHPEREVIPDPADIRLFRHCFGGGS